jgi:hypothetical protein
MPASSIHLGRGDNWGIPDDTPPDIRTAWADSIVMNYIQGISLFDPTVLFNDRLLNFDDYIRNEICNRDDTIENEIPDIFLEALTFKSSFTDKIITTSQQDDMHALNA